MAARLALVLALALLAGALTPPLRADGGAPEVPISRDPTSNLLACKTTDIAALYAKNDPCIDHSYWGTRTFRQIGDAFAAFAKSHPDLKLDWGIDGCQNPPQVSNFCVEVKDGGGRSLTQGLQTYKDYEGDLEAWWAKTLAACKQRPDCGGDVLSPTAGDDKELAALEQQCEAYKKRNPIDVAQEKLVEIPGEDPCSKLAAKKAAKDPKELALCQKRLGSEAPDADRAGWLRCLGLIAGHEGWNEQRCGAVWNAQSVPDKHTDQMCSFVALQRLQGEAKSKGQTLEQLCKDATGGQKLVCDKALGSPSHIHAATFEDAFADMFHKADASFPANPYTQPMADYFKAHPQRQQAFLDAYKKCAALKDTMAGADCRGKLMTDWQREQGRWGTYAKADADQDGLKRIFGGDADASEVLRSMVRRQGGVDSQMQKHLDKWLAECKKGDERSCAAIRRNYAGVAVGRPVTRLGRQYLQNACASLAAEKNVYARVADDKLQAVCLRFAAHDRHRDVVPEPAAVGAAPPSRCWSVPFSDFSWPAGCNGSGAQDPARGPSRVKRWKTKLLRALHIDAGGSAVAGGRTAGKSLCLKGDPAGMCTPCRDVSDPKTQCEWKAIR